MSTTPLHAALDHMELSRALTDADLGLLERHAAVRKYERGRVLWRAGTTSAGLFVVLRGEVRVVRSRRGRQHLVHVGGPGSTMGEVSVFGGGDYPATAIVSKDVECVVIPPEVIRALASRNPAVATRLLARVCRRVAELVARLEAQTLGGVRARLAASLVGLAAESTDAILETPRPQAEWAEDLGTVREVLARELAALDGEGLIERLPRGRVRILDEERLQWIALGHEAA